MGLHIVAGDITKFDGDVIVNAANPQMLGGGGVDGAIHRAAGPDLHLACEMVPEVSPGVRCPVGEVRPTPAFDLKCKWVFHTAGPIFDEDRRKNPLFTGEGETDPGLAPGLLFQCYWKSMRLADAMGLKSIAFPAISTGVYGCPQEVCASVALLAYKTLLGHNMDLDVTFYIFPAEHLSVWLNEFRGYLVDD